MKRPGSWVLFLGVLGLVPLLAAMTPGDPWRGAELPWAMARAWTLPVGVAGGVLGMRALRSIDGFLLRLPASRRTLEEVGSLLALPLLLHAVLLLGAWIAARSSIPAAAGPLALEMVLTDLHIAGLCGLILCARLPHLAGSILLLLLTWLLPGAVAGAGLGLESLVAILDTSRYGALGPAGQVLAALRVPVAFVLAAWLLRITPRLRRPGLAS